MVINQTYQKKKKVKKINKYNTITIGHCICLSNIYRGGQHQLTHRGIHRHIMAITHNKRI